MTFSNLIANIGAIPSIIDEDSREVEHNTDLSIQMFNAFIAKEDARSG